MRLLLLLLLPVNVQAMTSLFESGSLVSKGEYEAIISSQFLNGNQSAGVNLVGQVATGVSDSESFKVSLGMGTFHAQLGGSYKWIPYPDTDTQPAIGGVASVRFAANKSSDNVFGMHVGPIVSKYVQFATGAFDVYSSMLFGSEISLSDMNLPVSFNLGAEIESIHVPELKFYTELAIGLTKASYSIFGIGVSKLF